MTKKIKKLVLAKETVRSLDHSALQRIAGGVDDTEVCSGSCQWYCLGTWWCEV